MPIPNRHSVKILDTKSVTGHSMIAREVCVEDMAGYTGPAGTTPQMQNATTTTATSESGLQGGVVAPVDDPYTLRLIQGDGVDVTASSTADMVTFALTPMATITAGTYTNPTIELDAKGRITSIAVTPPSAGTKNFNIVKAAYGISTTGFASSTGTYVVGDSYLVNATPSTGDRNVDAAYIMVPTNVNANSLDVIWFTPAISYTDVTIRAVSQALGVLGTVTIPAPAINTRLANNIFNTPVALVQFDKIWVEVIYNGALGTTSDYVSQQVICDWNFSF